MSMAVSTRKLIWSRVFPGDLRNSTTSWVHLIQSLRTLQHAVFPGDLRNSTTSWVHLIQSLRTLQHAVFPGDLAIRCQMLTQLQFPRSWWSCCWFSGQTGPQKNWKQLFNSISQRASPNLHSGPTEAEKPVI